MSRKISLEIDIVAPEGLGAITNVKNELANAAKDSTKVFQEETRRQQKITDEFLQYKIAQAKAVTAAEAKEAARQEKIAKETLEYKVARIKEETASRKRLVTDILADAQRQAKKQVELEKWAADQILAVQANIKKSLAKSTANLAGGNITNILGSGGGPGGPGGGGGGGLQAILGPTVLGGLVGGGAAGAIGFALYQATSIVKTLTTEIGHLGLEAIKLGANFEISVNALTVFTGSTSKAKVELAAIDKLALETTGLRMQTAEVGYTRLRALGFAAETAKSIITGLAKQRYLSGATDQDIERVIVNLNQLSAGSSRASQDIKEMVHSIPSLRKVLFDTFGTLDYSKIGKDIAANPAAAFDKLGKKLNETKQAQGGLNNAVDKFADSWIDAGRAFSQPLLAGLTSNIESLTEIVKANRETFTSWGQTTADSIGAVVSVIKDLKAAYDSLPATFTSDLSSASSLGARGVARTASGGLSEGLIIISEYGKELRKQKEEAELIRKLQEAPEKERGLRKQMGYSDSFIGPVSEDMVSEHIADLEKQEYDRQQQLERDRTSNISRLQAYQSIVENITKNYYEVEEARQKSHITYTLEQERAQIGKISDVKKLLYGQQIADTTKYYDQLLANMKPGSDEFVKAESEKYIKLRDLNTSLIKESYDFQRSLEEIDRRIVDRKRQTTIELKNLQSQAISLSRDNTLFDLQRELSRANGDAEEQFSKLISATESTYKEIVRLTSESYAEQLKDQSLSAEQRVNLELKQSLEIRKLAEDNRRALIAIDDQKTARIIANLKFQRQVSEDLYQYQSSRASSIQGNFFSPENFSTSRLNLFRDSVLGGDKQKEIDRLRKEAARITSPEYLASIPSDYSSAITKVWTDLTDNANRLEKNLKTLKDTIPANYYAFERLADTISTKNIKAFDDLNKSILIHRQLLDRSDAISELEYWESIFNNESDGDKKREADFNRQRARRKLEKLDMDQAIQAADEFAKSIDGINKRYDDLYNDDKARAGIIYNTIKKIGEERNNLASTNIELEVRLANIGSDSAERYRNAWLTATYDVKNANILAVEEQIRAQVKLADATNIHIDQIRAKVLGHLAAQKSMSDLIADGIIEVYDKATGAIDKMLDKIGIGKIPGVGSIAKGLAHQAVSRVTQGLLDALLPGSADLIKKAENPLLFETEKHTKLLEKIALNTGGLPAGYRSSSSGLGSIMDRLPGIFGGGIGPGGTPNYNPAAGGIGSSVYSQNSPGGTVAVPPPGSGGGIVGMFGGLGSMFSPMKNLLTGKMPSMAGIAGGIGSIASMAGGMIGGKWGNLLSMAGTGVAMGANFGPWGALIGGLIGGGAGLIMALMGGGAQKKLKKAAKSAYQIDIKDKSILKQLETIGDGTYGKGQSGKRANEVVRLDMARELLLSYAESTGQNTRQLEGELYFDENYKNNISTISATPQGTTASLRSASYDESRVTSGASASGAGNRSGSSETNNLLRAVIAMLDVNTDATAELRDRITGISPEEVVALGLGSNPSLAADAVNKEYQNNPYRTEDHMRNTGQL